MEQNEKTICVLAVETFGPQSQIDMAIEECAELINALCKLRRERVGTFDVVTEIADVQIMCEQLSYMFGEQTVADERKRKIERLQRRVYCPGPERDLPGYCQAGQIQTLVRIG